MASIAGAVASVLAAGALLSLASPPEAGPRDQAPVEARLVERLVVQGDCRRLEGMLDRAARELRRDAGRYEASEVRRVAHLLRRSRAADC